jgi:hypothetical protein
MTTFPIFSKNNLVGFEVFKKKFKKKIDCTIGINITKLP